MVSLLAAKAGFQTKRDFVLVEAKVQKSIMYSFFSAQALGFPTDFEFPTLSLHSGLLLLNGSKVLTISPRRSDNRDSLPFTVQRTAQKVEGDQLINVLKPKGRTREATEG